MTVCVYEIVPEVYAGGSNMRQPGAKNIKEKNQISEEKYFEGS